MARCFICVEVPLCIPCHYMHVHCVEVSLCIPCHYVHCVQVSLCMYTETPEHRLSVYIVTGYTQRHLYTETPEHSVHSDRVYTETPVHRDT